MKDIADEIMEMLGEHKTEVLAAEKPASVEIADSDIIDRGDGITVQEIKFSSLFWEPETVPDHLVKVFTGYTDVLEPDPDYVYPRSVFEELSFCFATGTKPALVGPTGSGKNKIIEEYSARTGRPYLRIDHNQDFDKATVVGQVHISTDEEGTQVTMFEEGVLPKAMVYPTIIHLDETSRNTGHANIIYQSLLDRGVLAMPEHKEEDKRILRIDPDALIVAADNTKGNGDDMDKYTASNVQDAAFINRLDAIITHDYMSESKETELIQRMAPTMPADMVCKLATFSRLMHDGYNAGTLFTAFSPRNLAAITKWYESGLPIRQAIKLNYLSRATKSETSDILETIEAVFD